MDKKRVIVWCCAVVAVALAVMAVRYALRSHQGEEPQPEEVKTMFGIEYEKYDLEEGEIASGQSLSVLLGGNGVSARRIDLLSRDTTGLFDPLMIRAGHHYHLYFTQDTTRTLTYMVYQQNRIDYLVLDLRQDTIGVSRFQKEVVTRRMRSSGTIDDNLWNCMVRNGMSPGMASEMSDIYAWSIDFFGIQKGDNFTVIYDEEFVDSTSVGTSRIWGAIFNHAGKEYYAIPFKQGEKITYWDENGNSLRKNLLKAPLKYSRISSRFSNGRMHPILKIRRAHHAVDYAAPSGTEVHAVADGTVISCGYAGGGGNTVKIKHAGGLQSGYLHLRGFAKGIRSGVRVSQGDLIGWVGSTGLSTGPHLDFRLSRNGTPIDPLKVPSEPTEPINTANREAFGWVRDRILAEIKGTLPDSLRITRLDSLDISKPALPNGIATKNS